MEKRDPKLVKLDKLKKEFIDGKHLSIKDICLILDLNRTQAYSYINMLKNGGLRLCTESEGHTKFYYLDRQAADIMFYYPVNEIDILRFRILSALEKQPMVESDLYRVLEGEFPNQTSQIKVSQKKETLYNKTINSMLNEEGLLLDHNINDEDKRYLYPSGNSYPLTLNINFEDIQNIISTVAEGQTQGNALRSLLTKIAVINGDNKSCHFDDTHFWQYGRGYHTDDKLTEIYHNLINNHVRDKVLSFDYNGQPVKLHTGLLVYSQDKDTLYLMGHNEGTRSHTINIYKYSLISNLEYIEKDNKEYLDIAQTEKYLRFLNDMFSISTEKAQKVIVHFKNTEENFRRIHRLSKLRLNSSIDISSIPGKIVYTDHISGLNDFADYLREFGNTYTVIEPPELKNQTIECIERTINRYKELKNI